MKKFAVRDTQTGDLVGLPARMYDNREAALEQLNFLRTRQAELQVVVDEANRILEQINAGTWVLDIPTEAAIADWNQKAIEFKAWEGKSWELVMCEMSPWVHVRG